MTRAALPDLPFDPAGILIGGAWQPAAQTWPVTDPSTGAMLGAIARASAAEVDQAVSAAQAAADADWGHMPAVERGRVLARLSRLVLDHVETLATLESLDVGKPLSQARADAVALARYCEFYGGAADKLHGETIPFQPGYTVYTLREPHGVTGHIVPWNYPMQIIGRSVGASLAAGNACVVKPAEDASLTALYFGHLAQEAGLPPGALNILPGLGAEAGAALAGHRGIHHLSFTGSVATGAAVQAATGRNAVPVTLELGGKSPQIVFADADLDAAMPFLVRAGLQNAGQTCSAASRILVQAPLFDTVARRMAEAYAALRIGPAQEDPDIGPVINGTQRDRILGFLDASDAPVLARTDPAPTLPAGGHYVPACLLGPVQPDAPIAQQEVFGPVQVLIPFETEADAVKIANNTPYGLVAAVWTQDGARQMRQARALRAGQVFINDYGAGGGVELPFGGTGQSGHGREKGFEALLGFTRLKTVAARHG